MEFAPEVLKRSIESLLKLQEIDGQLFQVRDQILTVPPDFAAVKNKLAEAQKSARLLEKVSRDIERERRSLELRNLTLHEDVKKAEAKKRELRNSKEEFSANKEHDNFQRRMADNKKILDEKTEAGAQKTAAKDAALATVATLEQEVAVLDTKRSEDVKNLEATQKKLIEQRDAFISTVDDTIFSLYERVQKIRKGNGIALVAGNLCQGCHVALPPQTRFQLEKMDHLITCPSCSRILFPQSEVGKSAGASASQPPAATTV